MGQKTVDQLVVEIIAQQLGAEVSDVTPEKSLVDDLGADSIDLMEIVMAIENEYGIEIDDDDAEQVQTVAQAIGLVRRYNMFGRKTPNT